MNICQTSIKTGMVFMYLHLQQLVKVRDTTMVPSELNKGGVVKRTNTGLPNKYHIMELRKLS